MGVKKVTVYGGKSRWEVDYGKIDGKRKRAYFTRKAEAEGAWKDFHDEKEGYGNVWAQLGVHKRVAVARALERIEKAGTTIEELLEFWETHRADRAGETLLECVDEFTAAREGSGLSKSYLDQLRAYLRKFAVDREKLDVSEITPSMLDKWFSSRKESTWTRQTGVGYLSALFEFCVRRGYLDRNPAKRIERVRLAPVKREMLTADECQRLVVAAYNTDRGLLTYLGLALFCGIRPEEAKRITGKDIDLERGVVTIEAAKSKVRNIRFVDLTEPAKHCLRAGKRFKKTNFRRRFDALRAAAGIKHWPHDVMRKTAASHFYNLYGIDKATEQLGHSAGMMLRVYRNLVTEAETVVWVQIVPVPLTVVESRRCS